MHLFLVSKRGFQSKCYWTLLRKINNTVSNTSSYNLALGAEQVFEWPFLANPLKSQYWCSSMDGVLHYAPSSSPPPRGKAIQICRECLWSLRHRDQIMDQISQHPQQKSFLQFCVHRKQHLQPWGFAAGKIIPSAQIYEECWCVWHWARWVLAGFLSLLQCVYTTDNTIGRESGK